MGPNILIGLEIAIDTYFPLTVLTIEKFTNGTHSEIKNAYPEYDKQNKTIKVLNECCFCESIVSYQLSVEHIFGKGSSEKMHIYLFQGNKWVITAILLNIFCSLDLQNYSYSFIIVDFFQSFLNVCKIIYLSKRSIKTLKHQMIKLIIIIK